MRLRFSSLPKSTALCAAILACSTSGALANDGYFNVSYNDIGITLTQIGGYGEVTVAPNGFADMAFGECLMNFTRDETGAVKDKAAVITKYSANCPESMNFSVAPGEDGLYKITFTEGGALAGNSFDLFPVLQPMRDEFKVAAPKGFDILGMTVGMTRAEMEEKLQAEGFAKSEDESSVKEYTNGMTQAYDVWTKGASEVVEGKPEDIIGITYSTLGENAGAEVAEALSRSWDIPKSAKLSVANLKKSLDEKHGPASSVGEARFYDRQGTVDSSAYQLVCDPAIHLQSVEVAREMPGTGYLDSVSAACGAKVDVMVIESYDVPGQAAKLLIALLKGDVAYEGFWNSWSAGEAKALAERYEMNASMVGEGPKL
ncbi:hypothetical protein Q9295_07770 [Xinfangfangia sp. CPCC 101601]|uniref:Uncharacterized protein n=1 Tax=Pseudogemmobacter lacusdianii TaxID=3069608 RepID=A0ABU0VWZ3_9RHOB|nr:hypothetical protein [Xinfangfangia sp. CPCC 101601]MDQ2066266.1 hypothetical protein [Xinfangfangia sp. CPCC 101601]